MAGDRGALSGKCGLRRHGAQQAVVLGPVGLARALEQGQSLRSLYPTRLPVPSRDCRSGSQLRLTSEATQLHKEGLAFHSASPPPSMKAR